MHPILILILGSIFISAPLSAKTLWPTKAWPQNLTYQKKNALALTALDAFLFPENPPVKAPHTEGILLIKEGKLIWEKYTDGYQSNMRHLAWSVGKSLSNAILAIAIREHKLSLSDSICKYLKTPDKSYCNIQVEHLAHHTSGLNWSEDYEDKPKPKDSDVVAMLYGEGIADAQKFILNLHKPLYPPGTRWNYSSGDTNLLMAVLQSAVGEKDWPTYPKQKLFEPLGMTSAFLESDAKGVFIGSSYLYATAADLAKFGYLYLNKGLWESTQVLPEGWVDYSVQMAPAVRTTPQKVKPGKVPEVYGAHWWLNFANPDQGLEKPWPSISETAYAAIGHWGQHIIILPDDKIVAVRFGNDREAHFDVDRFLTLVREFSR